MKRLNNKGFAISGVVYSMLLLFIVLLYALLSILANRKIILDKSKNDILKVLDNNTAQAQKFRYVRDYIKGNSANIDNHWVEIQVFDFNNNLISGGKLVTANFSPLLGNNEFGGLPLVTDNVLTTVPYVVVSGITTPTSYVEIDLGVEYEIGKVIVWHYYRDARTYHDTKTILYTNNHTYGRTIFDSTSVGEYPEGAAGNTIIVPH